jgi:SprT-like family
MARNVNRTIESKEQSYDQEAITPVEYSGLQEAYDHFNRELFDGQLPDVFITYQRHANSAGHFSPDRFAARVGKFGKHELALNPDGFIGRSDKQICSTLGHEQHHVWQQAHGKPSPRGYHNKEWAAKMKAIGLQPSNTGMVGGKETGQRMLDYIIPDGAFTIAFAELASMGWRLNLQSAHRPGPRPGTNNSKTKFTCSRCGQNVWGRPDSHVGCWDCKVQMLPASLPAQSYEPQPATSYDEGENKPKMVVTQSYETIEQPKHKRGRPKGSKNKPKEFDAASPLA